MFYFVKCFTKVQKDGILFVVFEGVGEIVKGTVVINWVIQLLFFRNPCCASSKTLNLSKWDIQLLNTTCSKILQVSDVKDMGL